MSVEEALAIVDTVIKPERLNAVQELVLRQCWSGQTYQEIADGSGYDADYIRVVGSRLWHILSEVFGEKITKNNIRSVIRERLREVELEELPEV
ncbi:MAG: serine/threonine protein kinase, partial [Moorea sp. SIO3I6]|nr:serine/threonine protein kinase [Moorena sp. SIO3I6]